MRLHSLRGFVTSLSWPRVLWRGTGGFQEVEEGLAYDEGWTNSPSYEGLNLGYQGVVPENQISEFQSEWNEACLPLPKICQGPCTPSPPPVTTGPRVPAAYHQWPQDHPVPPARHSRHVKIHIPKFPQFPIPAVSYSQAIFPGHAFACAIFPTSSPSLHLLSFGAQAEPPSGRLPGLPWPLRLNWIFLFPSL